jgi:antitoxin Phd
MAYEVMRNMDSKPFFTMEQANQDFSHIAKTAEKKGEAIIIKNNKPKYIVVDMEKNDSLSELSEDEKIDIVAKRILEKYLSAFKELAE